ncbi:MAG: DUF2069 domain-containing protein [Betaproteobacteria bacterium]|nr:DUF2069 domain-containing protein [Betaproteobacteria bacterium]
MMRSAQWVSSVTLIALIALFVAWELVLAPMRPGGSWLVLKVLPLLLPLRGILHGRRYTYQWSSLLACVYLGEGLTRAWTDAFPSNVLAAIEAALCVVFLVSTGYYAKATRPSLRAQ